MALQQDDTPFTWGAGGARLTTEEIAQRRKVAETLMQQGTDASPLPAGTRGAGIWTQGLARVAKSALGAYQARQADEAAKANADDNKAMIASLLSGGTQSAGAPMDITPKVATDATTPGVATDSSAPRGIRNNNPLNIEDGDFAKSQPGYAGSDGRFAKFASPDHGVAAADSLLNTYQTKHGLNTINGIVNRWAPTSDGNNTSAYAADVAKQLGIDPNAPIPPEKRQQLIAAMGRHENGVPIPMGAPAAPQASAPAVAPVQVASNGPVQMPAATPTSAPPSPAVANVAAALSPSTVQGAAYPSPVLDNTGPAVPSNFNIPGMPQVQPMSAQDPVRFAGQPGFVPPQPAAASTATEDAAIPENATPTEGVVPASVAKIVQAQNAAVAPSAAQVAPIAAAPAVARVAQAAAAAPTSTAPVRSGIGAVNPAVLQALTSPYSDENTKKIASIIMQQQMTPKEVHAQETDSQGNVWDVNRLTGQRTVALQRQASFEAPYRDQDGNLVQKDSTGKVSVLSAADKTPDAIRQYEYAKEEARKAGRPFDMDFATWSTAKARAAATNITNTVDMNSGQTYDKQLAEGLGKAHSSLANGVEDAQSRARDIAAMQGAVDAIQKNGGTTGGLAASQRLELQKSINAGLSAIGIDKPFNEADLSDKEFLTKFNRSMAGAQAKNAVGSRVTNFEMSNFLKANPGLDMTITGNQRLLGIQSQMEQRNIAVGNAIRNATASAISKGQKIDPVTVQKIITDYDEAHHIADPVTGQDLTQSYTLPEFQNQGTNAALAGQHDKNIDDLVKKYSK